MRHTVCEALEGRLFLNAVPAGPEFPVNGTALGDQAQPVVASDATGAFVVAWQDGGNGEQVKARLFDAAGTPRGAEFRVDTAAPGEWPLVPAVAMDNDGDFVVAWWNPRDSQVYVRRYNTVGQALGDPFVVGPGAFRPAVAMDGDGGFAVVTGAFFNGALKRYSSSGTLIRSVPLQAHSDQAALTGSSVAMDDAGNTTVEWIEQDNSVPSPNAYRQQFNPDGTPTGPSTFILGSRALTPLPYGVVVVKNASGAQADVIDANIGMYGTGGIVSEGEFRGVSAPSAAIAEDGTFVVSFLRGGLFGGGQQLTLARRYDASGKALGDEFVLPGMSGGVALAPLPGGGFVAVDSEVSPLAGGGTDIHARLFAPAPKPAEVDRVYVRGTDWADGVLNLYQNSGRGSSRFGYAAGGTPDPLPLSWSNLDQVSVSFTRDVHIERGDLQVRGAGASNAVREFEYDPERKTATWTFDRAFGADRLDFVIDGDGFRYEFPLNVLPGDVDRSGRVNALDVALVKKHLAAEYTGQQFPNFINNYLSVTDVNADGRVNALDVAAVKRDLNRSLPAVQGATALLV